MKTQNHHHNDDNNLLIHVEEESLAVKNTDRQRLRAGAAQSQHQYNEVHHRGQEEMFCGKKYPEYT